MDAVLLSLESFYHPHHLIAKASSSVDPVLMSCRRKPMCLCRNFCVCKSRQGIDSGAGQPQGQGSLLHPVAHKHEMPLGINRYCCPQCSEQKKSQSSRKPCTPWSYIYSEVPPPHLGHWDVGALRMLYGFPFLPQTQRESLIVSLISQRCFNMSLTLSIGSHLLCSLKLCRVNKASYAFPLFPSSSKFAF